MFGGPPRSGKGPRLWESYHRIESNLYDVETISRFEQNPVDTVKGETSTMAISLSTFVVCALASWQVAKAAAATVIHDFNITWVNANPDGKFSRPVIGVNNEWPVPLLNFTKGDNVVFNVNNQLGNQSTSLHFHGLFQNGTTHMDGPVGVNQCGILPGSTFVYNFTVSMQRSTLRPDSTDNALGRSAGHLLVPFPQSSPVP